MTFLLFGLVGAGIVVTVADVPAQVAQQCTGPGTGTQPFSFLQSGFSQQLYATAYFACCGAAFAPNGDLWVALGPDEFFPTTPSYLFRFSSTLTTTQDGTNVHTEVPGTPFPSVVGIGTTNGANGNLYSNTASGIVMLDGNTGAYLAGPFGPPGSGLGIATDPKTGNLVYVGADDGTLFYVDPAFTTSGIFSSATADAFLDGIYFDPAGNFLFVAGSTFSIGGVFQSGLGVVGRNGNLIQAIPNPGGVVGSYCVGPDGVAFHAAPNFVVSNNRDGTMTRYDFPNGDFTQRPTLSTFASGGFRGDFTQVGPDDCLYVTQGGTRFADSTVSSNDSVVQICPNFVRPPGVNQFCSQSGNFNGTPIAARNYIWFNSAFNLPGFDPSHLASKLTLLFTGVTLTFTANGTPYTINAPNASITYDPSVTTATTSFAAGTPGQWTTTLPTTVHLAGNNFLDGVEFLVPSGGLPGGINPVIVRGMFSSTSQVAVQWQWAAAVYTSAFSTNYNALGVKPVSDNQASLYKNSDQAGTPEAFKSGLAGGGATGGGGSNYTGSFSGTTTCSAVTPAPAG